MMSKTLPTGIATLEFNGIVIDEVEDILNIIYELEYAATKVVDNVKFIILFVDGNPPVNVHDNPDAAVLSD